MMEKVLRAVARFSYNSHKMMLFILLVMTIAAIFFTTKLQLKTNFVSLLPQQSRTVKVFFESVDDFGMSDYFIICLQSESDQHSEKMMELADLIVENIKDSTLIEYIDYRLGDKEKDFYREIFLKKMVLFLDENGIDRLENALSSEQIQATLRKDRELLYSQVSLAVKKMIMEDPLRLSEIYHGYLPGQKGNLKFDLSDGYYLTIDQKMLLIMIKPKESFHNFEYNTNLLQMAENATRSALENLSREYDETVTESPISVNYTGGHVITLADKEVIKKDITRTVISSFIGILLLFVFAFRRFETILYIGLPLINGVIWTLGFSYLTIGSLNLITSVLSAIIMGLGVDFAIHLYNRYLDERTSGFSIPDSIEVSIAETGKGTLTGALTTAVAFFSMMLAPFKGLSDFGFMAGSGIILCYLSIVMTLPALIRLRANAHQNDQLKPPMRAFFIDSFAEFVIKYHWFILICGTIITVFALFQIPHIHFSDSIADLRAQSNKYMKVRDDIRAKIGGSLRYFLVVLHGPSPDILLEQNHRLIDSLQPLVDEGLITNISSITDYIPDRAKQLHNIERIRTSSKLDPAVIRDDFLTSLEANGFRRIPAFDKYLANITESLQQTEPISYADYETTGLAKFLNRFITFKDNEVRIALYLFPKESNGQNASQSFQTIMTKLEKILSDLQIDADVTGIIPVTSTVKHLVIESINIITSVAFILVLTVLTLHFRKVKLVIGALVPMTVGLIWMLGTMPLIGLNLNFFNIAIIPIIVGIGIDDGVHIIHRYKEGKRNDLFVALHLSGKAVVMTSLTTIIAFGSLYFSDYKGLAAMGYLAITGVTFSLICTMTLLPALIITWGKIFGTNDSTAK